MRHDRLQPGSVRFFGCFFFFFFFCGFLGSDRFKHALYWAQQGGILELFCKKSIDGSQIRMYPGQGFGCNRFHFDALKCRLGLLDPPLNCTQPTAHALFGWKEVLPELVQQVMNNLQPDGQSFHIVEVYLADRQVADDDQILGFI